MGLMMLPWIADWVEVHVRRSVVILEVGYIVISELIISELV
jgi:hypothetical protein